MKDKKRCSWCTTDALYIEYHDKEWGQPIKDDRRLFEMLVLESFQAGLSWITILKKRENFRNAFDDFDYEKIANYDSKKVEELMLDTGIVRNLRKIKATIKNANAFIAIRTSHGSFSNYIWGFVHHRPIINHYTEPKEIPVKTTISEAMSKSLKQNGFSFMGPVTCYAYMQATGMVNDHTLDCFIRN